MEKILLILSLIYNFTIGFFSFLIYLCTSFFMINYKCYIELAVTIVFIILLVPFNILVKRRVKINIILYILLNAVIYILGYVCYILVVRL
jgi:hypothetical protein